MSCPGDGSCFEQDDDAEGYHRGDCEHGCELQWCLDAHLWNVCHNSLHPDWLLNCYRGRCINCAIAHRAFHSKTVTEIRCCARCGVMAGLVDDQHNFCYPCWRRLDNAVNHVYMMAEEESEDESEESVEERKGG